MALLLDAPLYGYGVSWRQLATLYGYFPGEPSVPPVEPPPPPDYEPPPLPEEEIRRIVGRYEDYPFTVGPARPIVVRHFNIDKPDRAIAATLHIHAYDPDASYEGVLYINDNGPIYLWGDSVTGYVYLNLVYEDALVLDNQLRAIQLETLLYGYNEQTVYMSFNIPPGWVVDGDNIFRFEITYEALTQEYLVDASYNIVVDEVGRSIIVTTEVVTTSDGYTIEGMLIDFEVEPLSPGEGGTGYVEPFYGPSTRAPIVVLQIATLPNSPDDVTWNPLDLSNSTGWWEAADDTLPAPGNDLLQWRNLIDTGDTLTALTPPSIIAGPKIQFDRSNSEAMQTAQSAAAYWNTSGGFLVVKLAWRTAPATSDTSDFRNNEMVVGTSAGNVGIYARQSDLDSGEYVNADYWDPGYATGGLTIECCLRDQSGNLRTISFDARVERTYIVTMRWNDTNFAASLDGAAETIIATEPIASLNDRIRVGGGGSAGQGYSDIDVELIVTGSTGSTAQDLSQTYAYAQQQLFYANHGFTTAADDTPASTHVPGRITTTAEISFEGELFDGKRWGGLLEVGTTSRFDLANPDGDLDYLRNFAVDGREYALLVGEVAENVARIQGMTVAHQGVGSHWEGDLQSIAFVSGDRSLSLQIPAQPDRYAGTGGVEGIPELTGRSKPLVLGYVDNFEPQAIDPGQLLYQISSQPITEVKAVYDRLAELTAGTARSSYEEIAANVPSAGQYDYCLTEGLLKLGSIPTGRVTVDVVADDTPTASSIVLWFLEEVAQVTPDNINLSGFSAFADLQPGLCGLALSSGQSDQVESVIRWVAQGVGAFFGEGRDGRYTMRRLDAPADYAPYEITENDLDRDGLYLEALPYRAPIHSAEVLYRQNKAVMTDEDIATTADEADRIRAQREWSSVVALANAAGRVHQTGRSFSIQSPLYGLLDARDEAGRVALMYGRERLLLRLTTARHVLRAEICDTVKVTLPRFGLETGRNMRVVSVVDDLERGVAILTVWG